jgi:aspartyl-tRNA(Asn)/glutamyl-tRNA(Gln) amidotransferase subunit C
MPPGFSGDEVRKVAALANLELEPNEVELFARQLGAILAYADEVQNVDTTGIPPTASVVSGDAIDRADELQPCLDRDEALAAAPDPALEAGFFRVPRVIG